MVFGKHILKRAENKPQEGIQQSEIDDIRVINGKDISTLNENVKGGGVVRELVLNLQKNFMN